MKLITKEIEKLLPKLGANDGKGLDKSKIIIKFFHCFHPWTWYASEGEKQENGDWIFFGLVRGFENELGEFALSELQGIRKMGLGIERDLHFGYDRTLAEAMEKRL